MKGKEQTVRKNKQVLPQKKPKADQKVITQKDEGYSLERLLSIVDANLPQTELTQSKVNEMVLEENKWELEQKKIKQEEELLAAKARELGIVA